MQTPHNENDTNREHTEQEEEERQEEENAREAEPAPAAEESAGAGANGASPEKSQESPAGSGPNPLFLGVIIVIIAAIVAAGLIWSEDIKQVLTQSSPSGPSGNDNGAVVARVAGEEITRAELNGRLSQQVPQNASQQQRQQAEQQVLTNMVNEEVLYQRAKNEVSVSDEEIQQQIDTISGNFESEEAFQQRLDQNNLDQQALRSQVKRQLIIQQFVDQYRENNSVEITDEEVQNMYDSLAAQQGTSSPPLEQVRPQIEQQLEQQKIQQELTSKIEEWKKNIDVKILL